MAGERTMQSFFASEHFYLAVLHTVIEIIWASSAAMIVAMTAYSFYWLLKPTARSNHKPFVGTAAALAFVGTFIAYIPVSGFHWSAFASSGVLAMCAAAAFSVYRLVMRLPEQTRGRLAVFIYIFLLIALPSHVYFTYHQLTTQPVSQDVAFRSSIIRRPPLYMFFNITPLCCSDNTVSNSQGHTAAP
jgi:hypothetical protein